MINLVWRPRRPVAGVRVRWLGFRLPSTLAIWQLRFRRYSCIDCGIGNRLPVPDAPAETDIQRQGRTSRVATIQGRILSVRSIPCSRRAITLASSPLQGPVPSTLSTYHPHVETVLPHSVTACVDWIFQWRESLRDRVYSVPGFLIIPSERATRVS